MTFQSCLENPTSISKPVNLYIFSSEQMMSKLIEAEQKVKNLEPTRQQHRGISDENKAINMYVQCNLDLVTSLQKTIFLVHKTSHLVTTWYFLHLRFSDTKFGLF